MAVHILVPLDNSDWSSSAGELALQLALAQPSRITALRVVNVRAKSGNLMDDLGGRLGFEPAVVDDEVARERGDEAAALVADWTQQARARGVETNGIVEVGGVGQAIRLHSDDADLLVMGMRGETEESFPTQGGELASWISEHVTVPVLFATPSSKRITRVAVGFDGSAPAKHAVAAVRRYLEPLAVPIHAIYVSSDGSGEETLSHVDQQLPGCNITHHVVRGASVEDALVEKSLEVGAELLVMGLRGKSALRDFLFGSTTERVLVGGELAVMVTD